VLRGSFAIFSGNPVNAYGGQPPGATRLSGQTPDEIYSATAAAIAAELAAARKAAFAQRLAVNRATWCHQCETDARRPEATGPAVPPDSSIASPTVTLLRTVEFGMS
jgi:hypothetical protein